MLLKFICDNSTVLSVINIVKIVIKIIQIAVPICLLVSLIITLVGDVTKGGDELLSGFKKKVVPSCIAVVAIFLIPTFVKIVVKLSSSEENNYSDCIKNATPEKITQAKVDETIDLVDIALETSSNADYKSALRAVRDMDEGPDKEKLEEKLVTVKKILDIQDLVNKTSSSVSREDYNEVLEVVNSLEDGKIKDSLLAKLEEIKKKMAPIYPVNASDSLYSGLRTLSGKSIGSVLSQNGSSIEELNSEIHDAVINAGVGTREAAVAAATTLIGKLASYKYKLNYEWWGKYAELGIDSRWGNVLSSSQYNRDCNDYAKKHDGDGSNCWDNMRWYGLDCSGFAQWILIQAFQDKQASYFGGTRQNMNPNQANCSIGDPIYRKGHVAIIVNIKNDTKQYVIAESSQGVTLTNVGFGDGNWWCHHITNYSN